MWYLISNSNYSVSELLWSIVIFSSVVLFVKYHWSRRKLYKFAASLPGPPSIPILGNSYMIIGKDLEEIVDFILEYWYKYYYCTTRPVKLWIGQILSITPTIPEDIQIILNSPECFEKPVTYKIVTGLAENSMITVKQPVWKFQRKILNQFFSSQMCHKYIPDINKKGDKLLLHMNKKNIWPEKEFQKILFYGTADSIIASFTKTDVLTYEDYSYLMTEIDRLGTMTFSRLIKFWLLNDFIYNMSEMSIDMKEGLVALRKNILDKIIDAKKKQGTITKHVNEDGDLIYDCVLDCLIDQNDPDGLLLEGMKDNLSFFLFSSESTGSSLYNVLMMLAMHPDVQDKVYEEIHDILGNSDKPIEVSDVLQMVYLDQVIKETLRLFIPVGNFGRTTQKDIKLTNCTVPAGTVISLVAYLIHMNKNIWPDPEKFDPDRFSPENSNTRHKYSFLTFGAGPRICIGYKFALYLQKTLAAKIILKYKLETDGKMSDIKRKLVLTTRYRCEHPMRLIPR